MRMVHGNIRTVHTTYAAALKTTTNPKIRCRKLSAATQHSMLLMMGYVPETCRDKNTLIKLPCCIKLAFQIISHLSNIHCSSWAPRCGNLGPFLSTFLFCPTKKKQKENSQLFRVPHTHTHTQTHTHINTSL